MKLEKIASGWIGKYPAFYSAPFPFFVEDRQIADMNRFNEFVDNVPLFSILPSTLVALLPSHNKHDATKIR